MAISYSREDVYGKEKYSWFINSQVYIALTRTYYYLMISILKRWE